jgi:hypothetical protein
MIKMSGLGERIKKMAGNLPVQAAAVRTHATAGDGW